MCKITKTIKHGYIKVNFLNYKINRKIFKFNYH